MNKPHILFAQPRLAFMAGGAEGKEAEKKGPQTNPVADAFEANATVSAPADAPKKNAAALGANAQMEAQNTMQAAGRAVSKAPTGAETTKPAEPQQAKPAEAPKQQPPPNFLDPNAYLQAARQQQSRDQGAGEAKRASEKEPAIKKIEGNELKMKVGDASKEVTDRNEINAVQTQLLNSLKEKLANLRPPRTEVWHGDTAYLNAGKKMYTLLVDKSYNPPNRVFAQSSYESTEGQDQASKKPAAKPEKAAETPLVAAKEKASSVLNDPKNVIGSEKAKAINELGAADVVKQNNPPADLPWVSEKPLPDGKSYALVHAGNQYYVFKGKEKA